jgi:hypothetical protein
VLRPTPPWQNDPWRRPFGESTWNRLKNLTLILCWQPHIRIVCGIPQAPHQSESEPGRQELIDRSDSVIRHYYSIGSDAMRIIINALLANSRQPPQSILDFPSGSGRVTRHLHAFFPEARIVASDLIMIIWISVARRFKSTVY